VQVSQAVERPVKLTRTREEDMQHDVYRPNAGGRLRAVLDDAGYPLAIHARVAGQSLFGATRKSWLDQTPEGAWDESMVDGIYNQTLMEKRVPLRWQRESMIPSCAVGAVRTRRIGHEWLWRLPDAVACWR
jgi:hypothetical protein